MDTASTDDLLGAVADAVRVGRTTSIATVNAEYVVRAHHERQFAGLLERTSINTADGYGVVLALRRRGYAMAGRVGGSDLVWSIPKQAAALGHRIFLLGSAEGVAAETGRRLKSAYPGLMIAGTHAGTAAPEDEETIVDLIRLSKADIVFVAYGSPQQDYWIDRNLVRSGAAVGIGVGGSMDYIAGVAVRAPRWMRESGFEWLWRLIRNPRRWRRMLALPVFAWMAWRSEASESSGRKST